MYQSNFENKLIAPDIESILTDYVPIQIDIDNTKLKAAQLMAQNMDLKRLINQENIDRAIAAYAADDDTDRDYLDLIIPALCYFTYSRLLLLFHGSYTESGYTIEEFGEARNQAKSVSQEMKAVGETVMIDVIDFLENENPSSQDFDKTKISPSITVFGGRECRSSN